MVSVARVRVLCPTLMHLGSMRILGQNMEYPSGICDENRMFKRLHVQKVYTRLMAEVALHARGGQVGLRRLQCGNAGLRFQDRGTNEQARLCQISHRGGRSVSETSSPRRFVSGECYLIRTRLDRREQGRDCRKRATFLSLFMIHMHDDCTKRC